MQCSDIMKRGVEYISASETAGRAAQLMRDRNIGFLPVCGEDLAVIGTLTDRDIATRVVASELSASTPVKDILTPEVVACRSTDDLEKAKELMGRHQKSRIICTDDAGRLAGVISLSDLAERDGSGNLAATLREVSSREATA